MPLDYSYDSSPYTGDILCALSAIATRVCQMVWSDFSTGPISPVTSITIRKKNIMWAKLMHRFSGFCISMVWVMCSSRRGRTTLPVQVRWGSVGKWRGEFDGRNAGRGCLNLECLDMFGTKWYIYVWQKACSYSMLLMSNMSNSKSQPLFELPQLACRFLYPWQFAVPSHVVQDVLPASMISCERPASIPCSPCFRQPKGCCWFLVRV